MFGVQTELYRSGFVMQEITKKQENNYKWNQGSSTLISYTPTIVKEIHNFPMLFLP